MLRARELARPQPGLRRLLARRGEGADGVLGGQSADHHQRGPAQGQGGRDQVGRGRVPRRGASIETVVVVRNTDDDAPNEGRARRLLNKKFILPLEEKNGEH